MLKECDRYHPRTEELSRTTPLPCSHGCERERVREGAVTHGRWRSPVSVQARARQLRRDMTPAEKRLWQRLRGRRIYGAYFRKQHAVGHFVVVSPHNYNSTTVGLASTIQVSATIPNFLITEYFVNFEAFGREIAASPFEVVDGYIKVPEAPGLGIELDEDALARHPYRQLPPRSLRQPFEEGP